MGGPEGRRHLQWTNGIPPSNATYAISGDAPVGGGDAHFIKQLGTSLGLDYYNGKFWSAWANESSDPATSPNPDYFVDTDPNHNPGDPQHTTNIYAIPINVTITGGSLSGSMLGVSAAGGSAPALGSTPAAPTPAVALPPGSLALSAGASSAGADAVDQVFALLRSAPATTNRVFYNRCLPHALDSIFLSSPLPVGGSGSSILCSQPSPCNAA